MADKQDKRNPRPSKNEPPIERRIALTEGRMEERGRKNGPPQAPTGGNVSKQWQRPKSQSTPDKRPKKT